MRSHSSLISAAAAAVLLASSVSATASWDVAAPLSSWVRVHPTMNSGVFVCQWTDSRSGVGYPGYRYSWSSYCSVALNGTEYRGTPAEMLVAQDDYAWAQGFPADAVAVTAAAPPNRVPAKTCRAMHPTSSWSGPFLGALTVLGPERNRTVSCVFSYSGRVLDNPSFETLFELESTSPNWGPSSATLAIPSATPTPSPSPTPSVSSTPAVPGVVEWVNATGHEAGYVRNAEVAGVEGRSEIYVCQGSLPSGDLVPGKWETAWGFCDVPYMEREINDADYEILIRSPYLVWAGAGQDVAGASLVPGGRLNGQALTICRAFHPTYRTGPHPGYTSATATTAAGEPACLFSYGGGVVHAPSFDVLWLLREAPANGTGAVPSVVALPSLTPTPSVTPSRSPSAGPIVPGAAQWWTSVPGSWTSGKEGAATITVCRGVLPSGEVVSGKHLSGYTFCNVAYGRSELLARSFETLRDNPLLAWVPAAAALITNAASAGGPAGVIAVPKASLVASGSLAGANVSVCRARLPASVTINGGLHPGYTDWPEVYGGAAGSAGAGPLCFVTYGGHVYRMAAEASDVLLMLPYAGAAANLTLPSPSASPAPAGACPSFPPTGSSTATPSVSGSAPAGVPAASPSASGVPAGNGTAASPSAAAATVSVSASAAASSPAPSLSQGASPSASQSLAATPSGSSAATATRTLTGSASAAATKAASPSASASQPPAASRSSSPSATPTASPTPSESLWGWNGDGGGPGGSGSGGSSSGSGGISGGGSSSGGSGSSSSGGGTTADTSGAGSGGSANGGSSGSGSGSSAAAAGDGGADAGYLFGVILGSVIGASILGGAAMLWRQQRRAGGAAGAVQLHDEEASASSASSSASGVGAAAPAAPGTPARGGHAAAAPSTPVASPAGRYAAAGAAAEEPWVPLDPRYQYPTPAARFGPAYGRSV